MKDRIKKIRKEYGLTQKAFAEKLGLKQNTVASYEMGRIGISDSVIFSICREFNVNENWLRNGNGEMKKDVDMDFSSICADIGINDEKAKEAIIKYYDLSDSDKELWWKFMERFIK